MEDNEERARLLYVVSLWDFQGNIKIAASLGEIDGDWEGANG